MTLTPIAVFRILRVALLVTTGTTVANSALPIPGHVLQAATMIQTWVNASRTMHNAILVRTGIRITNVVFQDLLAAFALLVHTGINTVHNVS